MDVFGGGSSTEALIGIAIGVIEAGMCKTRRDLPRDERLLARCASAAPGARSAAPVSGDMLHNRAYGWQSAGQSFAPTFMRHMYDYGTTPEQVAMVKVVHCEHASNNPKAYYKKRCTVEDVLNSRIICKPLHLLDCCVETDNATCDHRHPRRARDGPAPPAGADPRRGRAAAASRASTCTTSTGRSRRSPATTRKDILWPNAGVGPEDVDVTGSYDAFTFTTMLQLEDYGFCKKGEGGEYVSDGTIRLGGKRPQQHLAAGICARATRTA